MFFASSNLVAIKYADSFIHKDYELRYVDDVNKIHWPLEYERIIPVGFDERSSTIPRSSRYFRLDDSEK